MEAQNAAADWNTEESEELAMMGAYSFSKVSLDIIIHKGTLN
jgi:hypothetical protein